MCTWTLQKNVSSVSWEVECSLYVRFCWFIVLFKSSTSLLTFWVDILIITESRLPNSPTITVDLVLSLILSLFSLYIFWAFLFVLNMFIIVLLMNRPFYQYIVTLSL